MDTERAAPAWRGHVIVCGLDDVGLRVIEQLRIAGETVVVADDSTDPRLRGLVEEFGATFLASSGRRPATLLEAGLPDALALVCTDESDLVNLEVALLARRLCPGVRIVSQLGNEAVARAVARVTGEDTVLDVATIAAPSLAAACLDQHQRPVVVDGAQFVLRELRADVGSLRDQFGDLAPIAVVPADGGQMLICPGRDHAVAAGDRVVVIGPAGEVDERAGGEAREATDAPAGVGARFERREPRRPRRPSAPGRAPLRRWVRGFLASGETQLRWTLRLLLVVAVVSVVVLRLGYHGPDREHMSVVDAAYFTVETLTTVGFGDFNFAGQATWLRLWAILLMIVGATLVTVLYALVTNVLVSRRIAQSLGRQLATRMTEHVIVVGLGSVGLRVVETLAAAGQPVVVLERDEDNRFLGRARAIGVPIVFGDSTVPASLEAVNLAKARAVAVLTSNDLTNIETGLAVDGLLGERRARVPVVLRVFDRELAATVDDAFGFDEVRSTSALAAPWFVGAALGLDILATFYVDRQPMLVGRLTVADAGGLQGSTMAELSARIRVVAIRRRGAGALEYPPRRDTRFGGGDRAYLVGPYEELLQVLRRDQAVSAGYGAASPRSET